ncbi:MAG: DUF4126 domain-containing protein [Sphingomicrobium sp.]
MRVLPPLSAIPPISTRSCSRDSPRVGLDPGAGLGAAALAHAGKAGARAMFNASPEPFSNVVVSTGEDVATAGLLALAIANPIAAALVAAILVILSLWLVLTARRALKRLLAPIRRPAG